MVDAGDDAAVQIILNGADITNNDGVQAATDVLISGETLDVAAGQSGTSENARGIQGDVMVTISGGTMAGTATAD